MQTAVLNARQRNYGQRTRKDPTHMYGCMCMWVCVGCVGVWVCAYELRCRVRFVIDLLALCCLPKVGHRGLG